MSAKNSSKQACRVHREVRWGTQKMLVHRNNRINKLSSLFSSVVPYSSQIRGFFRLVFLGFVVVGFFKKKWLIIIAVHYRSFFPDFF